MAEAGIDVLDVDVPQLKILVCGRSGVGKSSLCNSLLGRVVCEEGHPDGTGLKACTETTEKLTVPLNGIVINIFDSPGLQDGDTKNDKKYVEDMYRKCKDADLVLYCMDMTASRFTPAEARAIGLITKEFGPAIWERCVFVLTKANLVPIPRVKRQAKIEYHENLFNHFRREMCSLLKKADVPEGGLHMVAAGYFDPELETNDTESENKVIFASEHCKANPGPPIVPVDFIPELWVTCLETMPNDSRTRFLQATALGGRIRNPTEDTRKMLEAATEDLAGRIADEEINHDHNPPAPFELNSNQQWRLKELVPVIGGLLGGAIGVLTMKSRAGAVGGAVLGAQFGNEINTGGMTQYVREAASGVANRVSAAYNWMFSK